MMDDFREGLYGLTADLHSRAVVRARIRCLREEERRQGTWMRRANEQLQERLSGFPVVMLAPATEEPAQAQEAPPAAAERPQEPSRPRQKKFEAV